MYNGQPYRQPEKHIPKRSYLLAAASSFLHKGGFISFANNRFFDVKPPNPGKYEVVNEIWRVASNFRNHRFVKSALRTETVSAAELAAHWGVLETEIIRLIVNRKIGGVHICKSLRAAAEWRCSKSLMHDLGGIIDAA